uniref:Uncharacterized protein n=1 Tax=Panagrolaimus superbus TaxID=310955 RepID=A0A914Z1Z3_9BILA
MPTVSSTSPVGSEASESEFTERFDTLRSGDEDDALQNDYDAYARGEYEVNSVDDEEEERYDEDRNVRTSDARMSTGVHPRSAPTSNQFWLKAYNTQELHFRGAKKLNEATDILLSSLKKNAETQAEYSSFCYKKKGS